MTPEEKKAKSRERYLANKERIEARRQERLAAETPEEKADRLRRHAESKAKHYAAHPEKALEKSRRAAARNKERRESDPEFKERWAGYQKKYQDKHREEINKKNREYAQQPEVKHRKRLNRGMVFAPGQSEETMREAQGNRCAICAKELPVGKNCHVDHSHTTGKVRALLCSGCNSGLGLYNENAAALRKAADYLDAHDSATLE